MQGALKVIFLIFLCVAIIAFQLTILPRLTIFGVILNLALAIAIAFGISQRKPHFSWLVFMPIFLLDLFDGHPVGFLTLSCWLAFSMVSWLAYFLFKKNEMAAVWILSVIGVSLFNFIFLVLTKLADLLNLSAQPPAIFRSWTVFLIGILMNSFLTVLAFAAIKKLTGHFDFLNNGQAPVIK